MRRELPWRFFELGPSFCVELVRPLSNIAAVLAAEDAAADVRWPERRFAVATADPAGYHRFMKIRLVMNSVESILISVAILYIWPSHRLD